MGRGKEGALDFRCIILQNKCLFIKIKIIDVHVSAGRHWIGGKRGEIIVGDEHVLMRTENISCNFAKQRRFSCTQQEIESFSSVSPFLIW
jgi:hypothetical protein